MMLQNRSTYILILGLLFILVATGCQTGVRADGEVPLVASGTIRTAEVRVNAAPDGR